MDREALQLTHFDLFYLVYTPIKLLGLAQNSSPPKSARCMASQVGQLRRRIMGRRYHHRGALDEKWALFEWYFSTAMF